MIIILELVKEVSITTFIFDQDQYNELDVYHYVHDNSATLSFN